MVTEYRYAVHLRRPDQRRIGEFYLDPDFVPLVEDTLFHAERSLKLGFLAPRSAARVEPVWDAELGEPFVSGIEVWVTIQGQRYTRRWGASYFRPLVRAIGSGLVQAKRLENGETFESFVMAIPEKKPLPNRRFETEEMPQPLAFRNGSLPAVAGHTATPEAQSDGEIPLLVHAEALDQATLLARSAPERETGGLLAGHLHRDRKGGEIWIEVVGLLPARHTEADQARLRFTPETWADLEESLAARDDGAIACGWIHSHCYGAVAEGQGGESADNAAATHGDQGTPSGDGNRPLEFFSWLDVEVHRTVFPRAYSVALVATLHADGEVTYTSYGWHRGRIVPRGFHLLRDNRRGDRS